MGEPVRIAELAERMIRLSGKEPGRDIEISWTGVRPGEKLHEVLWNDDEVTEPTSHPKILVAGLAPVDPAWLEEQLGELERLVDAGETLELVSKLTATVARAATAAPAGTRAASARRTCRGHPGRPQDRKEQGGEGGGAEREGREEDRTAGRQRAPGAPRRAAEPRPGRESGVPGQSRRGGTPGTSAPPRPGTDGGGAQRRKVPRRGGGEGGGPGESREEGGGRGKIKGERYSKSDAGGGGERTAGTQHTYPRTGQTSLPGEIHAHSRSHHQGGRGRARPWGVPKIQFGSRRPLRVYAATAPPRDGAVRSRAT